MACKEGQFDVVELMVKMFNINLNAQHVNGMTPFDSALSTVIGYSRVLYYVGTGAMHNEHSKFLITNSS